MRLVPSFPALADPAEYDVLTLLAATVFLEAEGESAVGKLGVAWVIRRRVDERTATFHDVILAPWQFSCWNADAREQTARRLAAAETSPTIGECWRAAAGALWRLLPDPVDGANHYLNVEATQRARHGTLPAWFDRAKIVASIDRHTFLRL